MKVRMRKGLGEKEGARALYGKVTDRENVEERIRRLKFEKRKKCGRLFLRGKNIKNGKCERVGGGKDGETG